MIRQSIALGVFSCLLWTPVLAEPVASMGIKLPQGPHPSVFLTSEEVKAVRTRADSQPWAKAIRAQILKQADDYIAAKLDIPHAEGQWSHWFSCKKDGGGLKSTSPTKHVCTVCGTVYSGKPYDQVYITRRHHFWLRGMQQLGAAYVLEAKPEYARRGREVLLEYASFYSDLKLHNIHGKESRSAGRLCAQTLDEAVTLCSLSMGYDCLYDAPCFSAQDHKRIADGLIRPMVKTIQRNDAGISNWQSWHNAGVGCAGFVLRDRALVDWAINGKSGFLFQMNKSVLPSGMWYEGAPSYHWYALKAHVFLMEAAARAGMDLYSLPIVKKMFDAPVRQLFPDLTFPAMNDSGRHSITGARDLYEVAYRRFRDPHYARLLDRRSGTDALFWGADRVDAAEAKRLQLTTSNCPDEGLAILRDKENQTALFLDYAPRGGGHIQPAKLGIILYALGDERIVDPGRLPYGNPMHREWYRQTIAHNTVVVDQESQNSAPAFLKAFAVTEQFAIARAGCDKAYPDVALDRTLCMKGNTIVDIFRCSACEPRIFDLPLHVRGSLKNTPPSEPVETFSDKTGYRTLKDVKRLTAPLDSFDVDTGKGNRLHVQVLDRSEAYLARGFGNKPTELLPVVLRRQHAPQATFVTVYQILTAGQEPRKATCDCSEETTVALPDVSVTIGETTRVTLKAEGASKEYRISTEGICE